MQTANLSLTPLVSAQAQKHVTVNEALARLDAAAHLAVLDRDLATPPASPADGDRYLVAPAATDAWQGREGTVAAWEEATGGWLFLTPRPGWRLWLIDEAQLVVRTDGGWQRLSGGTSAPADRLGVNTVADATNRLAVKSDAALLSHDDVTPGSGDMRLTLNKATSADDTSLTLQTGYATRAQIGLTGDDDLHIKVSGDGSTFTEAITVNAATADVTLHRARIAPGIGSFPNALPDGGRMCNWTAVNPITSQGFVKPGYLLPYNGTTIGDGGRFAHNNATHGGSGAALDPATDDLILKIRGGGNKRYGPEWHAAKVIAGTGTAVALTIGGDTFHLTMTYPNVPLFPVMTMGVYVKVLTPGGKITPYRNNAESISFDGVMTDPGNPSDLVLDDASGWVWVESRIITPAFGYSHVSNCFFATPGTEYLYALPKIVPGRAGLDGLEILSHQLFYSSTGI